MAEKDETVIDPESTEANDDFEPILTEDEKAALAISDAEADVEPFAEGSKYAQPRTEPKNEDAGATDGTDDTVQAGAGDDTVSAAGSGDGEGEAAAAKAADATATAAPKVAPLSAPPLPDDVKAKFTEFDTQLEALDAKFEEGELNNAEYRKAARAIEDQRTALQLDVTRAQMAHDMVAQQETQTWVNDYTAWGKDNPDVKLTGVPGKAFNAIIEDIEAKAKADNKPLSNAQLLEAAGKAYRETFGLPAPQPKAKAAVQRKDPVIPPSLRNLPNAEASDVSDSQTARMDKLATTNPAQFDLEYAAWVAKDPAAADAYLAR